MIPSKPTTPDPSFVTSDKVKEKKIVDKVNIKEKLKLFKDYWSPRILGQVNDYHVKVFKAKGEFVWHKHADSDEFFLVIHGELTIKLKERDVILRDVILNEGEFFIVPKGVEHCPYAKEECHGLLFEPKQVVNTGDADSDKTFKAARL